MIAWSLKVMIQWAWCCTGVKGEQEQVSRNGFNFQHLSPIVWTSKLALLLK